MADLRPGLRALFLERYNDFLAQLKRRLGSDELARDAMQETYLKVDEMAADAGIRQPAAYLFRMALNLAEDQRRRDARILTGAEVMELVEAGTDGSQDPARIAEGRSQVEAFRRALRRLPPRSQQIVLAARVHGATHAEIALRYGVSERIVSKELNRALAYCAAEMARDERAAGGGCDGDAGRGAGATVAGRTRRGRVGEDDAGPGGAGPAGPAWPGRPR